jgi:hypothetical protein
VPVPLSVEASLPFPPVETLPFVPGIPTPHCAAVPWQSVMPGGWAVSF